MFINTSKNKEHFGKGGSGKKETNKNDLCNCDNDADSR